VTLAEKIEKAFSSRPKPAQVRIDEEILKHDPGMQYLQDDPDVKDALWFSGRDRHELTCQDWREHSCAVYFFDGEAFAYYLPSVMIVSAENPNQDLQAADQIISELDQTPDTAMWTDGLVRRFGFLNLEELEALKLWLLRVCD
jgi:hypothetical protein